MARLGMERILQRTKVSSKEKVSTKERRKEKVRKEVNPRKVSGSERLFGRRRPDDKRSNGQRWIERFGSCEARGNEFDKVDKIS